MNRSYFRAFITHTAHNTFSTHSNGRRGPILNVIALSFVEKHWAHLLAATALVVCASYVVVFLFRAVSE